MQPQTDIVPRSKNAHGINQQMPAVVLTFATLEEHFSLPLNEAAKQLGVCETSLKRCNGLISIIRLIDGVENDSVDAFLQCLQEDRHYQMALSEGDIMPRTTFVICSDHVVCCLGQFKSLRRMNARHHPLPISIFESQQAAEFQLGSPDPNNFQSGHPFCQLLSDTQKVPFSKQAVPALIVHDGSMARHQRQQQQRCIPTLNNRQAHSHAEPLASAAAINALPASGSHVPATNPLLPAEPSSSTRPAQTPSPAPKAAGTGQPRPGASSPAPAAQLEPAPAGQGATPGAALPGAGLWPLPEPSEPLPLNLTRHIVLSPADPFHDDWAFW